MQKEILADCPDQMSERVRPVNIVKSDSVDGGPTSDLIVVEEPLEIRVGYGREDNRQQHSLTVTMRTPGDDEHLCLGFLFCEDIITDINEVISAKYCQNITVKDGGNNVMRVELKPEIEYNPGKYKRNFYTNSSCGVCGKASIEQVQISGTPVGAGLKVNSDLILSLPSKLLTEQDIFRHTGGVHACGLFNIDGQQMEHKEDVGRHNGLDKLIGAIFLNKLIPASEYILMLSGRISFELVQKAIKAGIPVIAAVGAPSSLAVELAEEFGVTLIGFIKESGFNVYTGKARIID